MKDVVFTIFLGCLKFSTDAYNELFKNYRQVTRSEFPMLSSCPTGLILSFKAFKLLIMDSDSFSTIPLRDSKVYFKAIFRSRSAQGKPQNTDLNYPQCSTFEFLYPNEGSENVDEGPLGGLEPSVVPVM